MELPGQVPPGRLEGGQEPRDWGGPLPPAAPWATGGPADAAFSVGQRGKRQQSRPSLRSDALWF